MINDMLNSFLWIVIILRQLSETWEEARILRIHVEGWRSIQHGGSLGNRRNGHRYFPHAQHSFFGHSSYALPGKFGLDELRYRFQEAWVMGLVGSSPTGYAIVLTLTSYPGSKLFCIGVTS